MKAIGMWKRSVSWIVAGAASVVMPITTPAAADTFSTVKEQAEFVRLVSDRDLTRFGIRLSVSPSGNIEGRAFGRKVTGAWQWRNGYFCRELYVGSDDLGGPDCQLVLTNGETVRFIADKGTGESADLTLR